MVWLFLALALAAVVLLFLIYVQLQIVTSAMDQQKDRELAREEWLQTYQKETGRKLDDLNSELTSIFGILVERLPPR